ncbi:ankyrin repeat domain-containing protein [Rickettsiales bacterium]|nr:ankyrin repeat domain-containing protein [Rickettsiales bacterium]
MYEGIFGIIDKAKCRELEKSLSKIRESQKSIVEHHALSDPLESYDNITTHIKKLGNKEIEKNEIKPLLSDFFNKICIYFEQELSKDSNEEKDLLALIQNALQSSGLQGQPNLHQYIFSHLSAEGESPESLPEYLKKLSDYLISLACDYELDNNFEKLGVRVNQYLSNTSLQCLGGEISRLDHVSIKDDNLHDKAFKALTEEFIASNLLPQNARGNEAHMTSFLNHILGQETSDPHAITPAQYLEPHKIIRFFDKFGVKFYEKLEELLVDEITDLYEPRISQIIAEEERIEKQEAEKTVEERLKKKASTIEAVKNTFQVNLWNKVKQYCTNDQNALLIFQAIIDQDNNIINSLTEKDDEAQDKKSNAQEIIKKAINSTKETRKDNKCSGDPINQLTKHQIYLSINPFKDLDRSSISYEEIKALVKLFQDDQQDGAQTAEPTLSKEEKRKLGLNLLRILHTGSKDPYNFKMQFLSALWLIEDMGRQSSIDDIDQFTQFTYFKSLFGYKKDEKGNITVSEEYQEYKHIIDLIINNSQNYSSLESQEKVINYLKYITQIEKSKITKELAKDIFMLGNLEGVELLLAHEDINVNATDEYGLTPLHWAAINGHSKVVELLLAKKDINPNVANKDGLTPLHLAADKGNLDVVELLLAKEDINLNAADKYGSTPLHRAAKNGHSQVVELLLAKEDINPNAANKDGLTPLHLAVKYNHLAVEYNHLEVLKILVAKEGIGLNATDKHGYNILQRACNEGKEEIVKVIIDHIKIKTPNWLTEYINTPTELGETPLAIAAISGHLNIVELLLEQEGIDVNADNDNGDTPLHCAAMNGRLEVVELLLKQKGINVNAANKDGFIPQIIAAQNSYVEVARLLGNNVISRNNSNNFITPDTPNTYINKQSAKCPSCFSCILM